VPTYQYACTACGEPLEVVQKFTDDSLTECPACTGQLRKVFSPVGIVFKGSGFYRTDSRTAASNGKDAVGATADKTGKEGKESKGAKVPSATGSTASSAKAENAA